VYVCDGVRVWIDGFDVIVGPVMLSVLLRFVFGSVLVYLLTLMMLVVDGCGY
jgi:hypothetical protein